MALLLSLLFPKSGEVHSRARSGGGGRGEDRGRRCGRRRGLARRERYRGENGRRSTRASDDWRRGRGRGTHPRLKEGEKRVERARSREEVRSFVSLEVTAEVQEAGAVRREKERAGLARKKACCLGERTSKRVVEKGIIQRGRSSRGQRALHRHPVGG